MTQGPLIDALEAYKSEGVFGFHTPGHRQQSIPGLNALNVAVDFTEVPGLDDLHAPMGPIATAQCRAASLFGAGQSFFLVQGATVGIQALCLAALKPGAILAVPRHSHRAVQSGLILSGALPVYIPSVCENETGLPIATQTLCHEIEADAYLALSPTYWGTAEDLAPWLQLSKGRPLFVDEAHGAAYAFHGNFPSPALAQGVHGAVQGSHKTLPAFTQSAMLHLGSKALAEDMLSQRVGQALSILQSTSPSYLLLASLDAACSLMEEQGYELWNNVMERACILRKKLATIKGIRCWGEEILAYQNVSAIDPTRLLITWRHPVSGWQAREFLRREYKVEPELAGPRHMLFMLSPFDSVDADQALFASLSGFAQQAEGANFSVMAKEENFFNWHKLFDSMPELILRPREAYFAAKRRLPFSEAIGKVCGEMLCPYPPGIPLAAPGEMLTKDIMEKIQVLKKQGVHWQGSDDPKLNFLWIIDE